MGALEQYLNEYKEIPRVELLPDNDRTSIDAEVEISKPFGQEFELKRKIIRLDELNHELAMDEKDDTPDIGDDNTPEEEKAKAKEIER